MKENISRFLFCTFFGNTNDIIYGAIDRAYRDMMTCRKPLVPEKEKKIKEKSTLKKRLSASDSLYCAIETFLRGEVSDYGRWHKDVCDKLRKEYNTPSEKIFLTYGQAQKWINMTIKYIYYIFTEAREFLPENLKDEKFKKVLISFKDEYHMPIDSYILNTMANKNISYIDPKEVWSNIDSYIDYCDYQTKIGDHLQESSRLEWEMKEWLNLSEIVKENEFDSLLKKHELVDVNKDLQHPRKRIN